MIDSTHRYQRQNQVSQLDQTAQKKLSQAHVLIVGAGGLGSPTSLYLVGAGIGELTLIDPDEVSLSNLHRQIIYDESDVSTSKVDAAKRRLGNLNRNVKINVINSRLGPSNVGHLVAQASVVIDASDSFLVSYLLSDACLEQETPLISASVLGTHGYLGVFCAPYKNVYSQGKAIDNSDGKTIGPSYRAVFPSPPSKSENCNTAGVTGPSVGIIGSYQAQEALKVIVGGSSQLLGKLMYVDLWDYRYDVIDFNGAPEPAFKAGIIDASSPLEDDILLDVRSEAEVSVTSHEYAQQYSRYINLPLDQLSFRHNELKPGNKRIVCVCQSGQRALNAAHWLLQNSYIDVVVSV